MMRLFWGILAIYGWLVIVTFMFMYFTAPPKYGDSSGYLAMSLFVLYFTVNLTGYAILEEDELRKNDTDLTLLFWPIILVMSILISPYIIYLIISNSKN